MKKKGFTVLETMVSLFIILIVFSCAAASGNIDKNIYRDIESEGFQYEVHDLLTYAKLRSKVNYECARITVSPEENRIYYEYGNPSSIKPIKVPDSMTIVSDRKTYALNERGRVNDSGTIKFQNYFNELKKIGIRVGVDYINLDDD